MIHVWDVLRRPDRIAILDTKWKSLDLAKRMLGVRESDVYQMLAYGQGYANEAPEIDLVLIYPRAFDNPPVAETWSLAPGRRLSIWTIPVDEAQATTKALIAMDLTLNGIDPGAHEIAASSPGSSTETSLSSL